MYYIEVIKVEVADAIETKDAGLQQDSAIVKNIEQLRIIAQILNIIEEDMNHLKELIRSQSPRTPLSGTTKI